MQAHAMSVETYQRLLDRGWRRSGRWMYRPELSNTCCPAFTIRLDVAKFVPSKTQKKVVKKWCAYLDGHLDDDGNKIKDETDEEEDDGKKKTNALGKQGKDTVNAMGSDTEKKKTKPPVPREFEIKESRASFDKTEFLLWKKYQASVHGDDETSLTENAYRRFLVDTPLKPTKHAVACELDGHEKGWIAWDGYPDCLRAGTGGDASTGGDDEEKHEETVSPAPPLGFGSFHHQYLVDGRLVAVGVVDVLPKCLSSKYFFYDPKFKWASLGKLSALREIEWVKRAAAATASSTTPHTTASQNQSQQMQLKYLYLGYYIHDCPKMRYKAEYVPSELKCPVTGLWTTLTSDVGARIKHATFAPLRDANDPDVLAVIAARRRRDDAGDREKEKEKVTTKNRTGDDTVDKEKASATKDQTDEIVVGLAFGGALVSVAPFAECRNSLPKNFAKLARKKMVTWKNAVGPAGNGIVYLMDLDAVDPTVWGGGGHEHAGSDSDSMEERDGEGE